MPKVTKQSRNKTAGAAASPVLQEVQKLYDFMQKNQLETVEYQQDGTHVRLARRRPNAVPVPVVMNAAVPAAGNQPAAPFQPAPYTGDAVKSPLMGIFFRAPSPASPPFVKEGQLVQAGQVLCLIEAMKVFNEVKAEFDCTVKKVLVENGKPVKPGQDIIAIERK